MMLRAAQQCAKGPTESTEHYENNNDLTFTLASSWPGCLWWASVSMGVIRRVGLSSQPISSGCSWRDQGSRRRTGSGTLTITTIIILILTTTTRTCCSGETLPAVKQRKDPGSPAMRNCMCVNVCDCICLWIRVWASCCLHNSLPVLTHSLALTIHSSFSAFTSPLCLPLLTVSLHIFMNFLFIMKTYAWK